MSSISEILAVLLMAAKYVFEGPWCEDSAHWLRRSDSTFQYARMQEVLGYANSSFICH